MVSPGPIFGVPNYLPQFLWKFWLSGTYVRSIAHLHEAISHCRFMRHNQWVNLSPLDEQRVRLYDVYNNHFSECRRISVPTRTVFQEFDDGSLNDMCRAALRAAETSFLESGAGNILRDLLTVSPLSTLEPGDGQRSINIKIHQANVLRCFFLLQ
jgi:hypothetical protein